MSKAKQQRGAHSRDNCVFIGVWIPNDWVTSLDALVKKEDSDRSKLIRKTIERKLQEVTQ